MVRVRVVYACARGLRRGPMRNLRAGPLPLRYGQIYIVALAQIRPPHCTISCLASRSAINEHEESDNGKHEKSVK